MHGGYNRVCGCVNHRNIVVMLIFYIAYIIVVGKTGFSKDILHYMKQDANSDKLFTNNSNYIFRLHNVD